MTLQIKLLVIFISTITLFVWGIAKIFLGVDDLVDIHRPHSHPRSFTPPFPDDRFSNVHWFVQVSDIHISKFYDAFRVKDLEEFCSTTIDVIKPEVVLASGDLTDAKHSNMEGSEQYEEEWKSYSEVLSKTQVTKKTVWLDVRGNHDAFDVPNLNSKNNYFSKYSIQGKVADRHYKYIHRTIDSKIGFVAVDANPDPGLKRPFNFVGILNKNDITQLEHFYQETKHTNMTIWFGHHPTSTVLSGSPSFRTVLSKVPVYMCGHLHTLLNMVPSMYASHKTGNMELELGDWRDNRIYRLFAVDHDLFSFVDTKHRQWPLILITNPKDARFNMPEHEPTGRMLQSTHIRMLVFSTSKITQVRVFIDATFVGEAKHVEKALYVLSWDPQLYKSDLHTIKVEVTDSSGRLGHLEQMFSLNNTRITLPIIPRIILLSNHTQNLKLLFIMTVTLYLFILTFLRFTSKAVQLTCSVSLSLSIFALVWLRRIQFLAKHNRLFYCLTGYSLYICFGPWFIGEFLTGKYGVCFIFGFFIDGRFIEGSSTFLYGLFQLILYNIPLTFYLAMCVDKSISASKFEVKNHKTTSTLSRLSSECPFIVVVIIQAYLSYFGFYRAYGGVALMFGPLRTWSIGLAFYLRRVACNTGMTLDKVKDGNGTAGLSDSIFEPGECK